MKRPFLLVAALLFSFSISAEAQLEFEGSYWETRDSFLLSLNFEGENPKVHWEGSPFQQADPARPDPERVKISFKLNEDEVGLLREFSSHFALCHSGYRMAVGTGLLTTATLKLPDADPLRYSYFSLSRQNRNARRSRKLPRLFYSLAIDGDFSAADRTKFFKEMASFTEDLRSHRKALDLLENAYAEDRNPDWEKVHALAAEPLFESEEERELAAQLTGEAALVVDALFEEGSPLNHLIDPEGIKIVLLNGLSATSETSYHSNLPLPFPDLNRENWAFLPPGLIPLFADFVAATDYLLLRQCETHPYFSIPIPWSTGPNGEKNPEWQKRLEYLRDSGIEASLFPSTGNGTDVEQVKIHSLEFSKNSSKCVAVTHHEGEALFTLLYVEDAEWKILRTIDSNDWKEYGWKEPLFK